MFSCLKNGAVGKLPDGSFIRGDIYADANNTFLFRVSGDKMDAPVGDKVHVDVHTWDLWFGRDTSVVSTMVLSRGTYTFYSTEGREATQAETGQELAS